MAYHFYQGTGGKKSNEDFSASNETKYSKLKKSYLNCSH